jgi:dienelactone hydrolase
MIFKRQYLILHIMTLSIVAILMPQELSASSKGEAVSFNAAVTPPSPLRQRLAKKRGEVAKPFPPERLQGHLYKAEAGSPGVILVPSCLGKQSFHHDWAATLNAWGYTALILDSLGSRGLKQNCAGENQEGFQQAAGERVFDIYGAHSYLTDAAGVDPKRIAIMGWGYSGILGAVLEGGAQHMFEDRFAGVAAYYPPCWTAFTGRFVAPVLVMVGDQDDWTPQKACEKMVESGKSGPSPVDLAIFPGAHHGFDNPGLSKKLYRPDVWNPSKEPTLGATLAYNKTASAQAQNQVKTFFQKRFKM